MRIGSPQWLYMAEAEGCTDLVSTRTAKLNAVAKFFRQHCAGEEITISDICVVMEEYGIENPTNEDFYEVIRKLG